MSSSYALSWIRWLITSSRDRIVVPCTCAQNHRRPSMSIHVSCRGKTFQSRHISPRISHLERRIDLELLEADTCSAVVTSLAVHTHGERECAEEGAADAQEDGEHGHGLLGTQRLRLHTVRMVAAHALAHLHAMREAISGNQWQSVAISGSQWQSVAISGNQWQSMAISGNQRPHTPSRTSLIGW